MYFKQQVIQTIQSVPKGKVVSYGQVAAVAGSPRAARQVGNILRAYQLELPWWRVVNSSGYISIKGNWTATKETQAYLLGLEGIEVLENFYVDMEKYRYKL